MYRTHAHPSSSEYAFLWIPLEVPGTTSWPGKVSSLNLLTCSSSTMPLGLLMIYRQERYFFAFVLFCFLYSDIINLMTELLSFIPTHQETTERTRWVRIELGRNFLRKHFLNRIPYLWNNLPDELRTANFSVSSFKKLCTTFYKDKAFDPERPHTTWEKISS